MASALNLHSRNIISNANCTTGFTWMDNQESKDPCLLVAYVIAACVGNSWTQPQLLPGYSYDAPSGSTATPCYCSWSCYNLMMACTWCQYPNNSSMSSWTHFSRNCSADYTDTYFPSGYTLSGNQTIPYWASIDPTKWTSEIFDVTQAQQYNNEDKPDLDPGASSGSGSSNLGPIVGGTIGGAVLVIILAIGVYYFYKSRKYNRLAASSSRPGSNPVWHTRQQSSQSTSYLQPGTAPSPPNMSYYTGASFSGTGNGSQSIFTSLPTNPSRTDVMSYTTTIPQRPSFPMV